MKLVGERRALASSVLIFYAFLYSLVALASPMPEWKPAYFALAGTYGMGFVALVAGYFWARWYGIGLALFGAISAAIGMWQVGPEPILLVLGGSHLAVVLCLAGTGMEGIFDGQAAWRTRYHLDDHGVRRLGKSVMRAAFGLPYILLYALAPRPGNALVLAGAVLAVAGFAGLIRLRTWGILAIGGAAALWATTSAVSVLGVCSLSLGPSVAAAAGATVLAAVAAPFAGPMVRALRG